MSDKYNLWTLQKYFMKGTQLSRHRKLRDRFVCIVTEQTELKHAK